MNLPHLNAWLVQQVAPTPGLPQYCLRAWKSDPNGYAVIKPALEYFVDEALQDARSNVRKGFSVISPFIQPVNNPPPPHDPAAGYPRYLHQVTLQGYLGELLSVLGVEHLGAHGSNDWVAPFMLFRFHSVEFDHLGQIQTTLRAGGVPMANAQAQMRPGRTGDDALAIRVDANGHVVSVLTLEAKCTPDHNIAHVTDACGKLVEGSKISPPANIKNLINMLSDYPHLPAAVNLQQSLLAYFFNQTPPPVRVNGLTYAYGRAPVRGGPWVSAATKPAAYRDPQPLEVMEYHLHDVVTILDELFRRP